MNYTNSFQSKVMGRKISATIVADSIAPSGDRITSFILVYPRMIHSELMTHRMFSRNAASSRAIPFKKMVQMIKEDPFIPIAWQKDHKGMQGTEYETDLININAKENEWLIARNHAINQAMQLSNMKVTKQLCNRLLEPFQWYTSLVTATEFNNFFALRCPTYEVSSNFKWEHDPNPVWTDVYSSKKDLLKDWKMPDSWTDIDWIRMSTSGADIHIQALAEAMWDAKNESTPKLLYPGEWHIPFGDKIDYALHNWKFIPNSYDLWGKDMSEYGIKVATARAARLSYMTFDGEIDYEKDIKLHNTLLESGHMSPFEHCARVMSDEEYHTFIKGKVDDQGCEMSNYESGYSQEVWVENNIQGWCNNFRGFIPYRYLVEHKKDL